MNSVPTIAQDCRKLVIVGASLAGLRAVEAARTEGFTGEIALIGDEQHLPYDRPPLSKAFLEGRTQDTTFRDVATLTDELGVQLHLGSPATGLDLEHRKVIAGGSEIEYDRLIIATGSTARTIDGGSALRGVHVLRTKDDAVAIREAVTPGARVIVVGGGFIGSEVASSCLKLGARATIVEAAPVPLTRAVGSLGAALTTLHGMNGVEVRTGLAVDELLGENRITAVRLSDGSILEADLLIVGIGSSPATSWLEHSGLALHPIDRGVLCDENLATNSDGVYAAGDVAYWDNTTFGRRMRLENWTSAAQQGGHAARNALRSDPASYGTVPYYWSDWYGKRIQFVGLPDAEEVRICSGSVEEGRLVALYRSKNRVIGALTISQPRHIMKLRAQIEAQASWESAVDLVAATEALVR
ncbi:Reductase C-terminal [Rhodococcus koreensis]|uniref:Reductase C-terminal n=1 Tax=Rhodococcus koreensis TaxID=99653 RepID=A0A1H4L395_9NOCA|nr:Reductase C-terminal [Rhodococcus koreensis]